MFMPHSAVFILTSLSLGIGLAMDAFSVSLANGLGNPCMKKRTAVKIAAVFAFFQALMPMLGWILVHTAAEQFDAFRQCVPYIALVLLAFIGGKMLFEGIGEIREGKCPCENEAKKLTLTALIVQGVATSIDALSVGLTIADSNAIEALCSALIIGAITFLICFAGVMIGRTFGGGLSGKATVLGGGILILIGLEIFVSSFF